MPKKTNNSTQRELTEARKKLIAGKQYYKCANEPDSQLKELEDYECPLWKIIGKTQGCFDQAGYEIDHIVEHCITKDDNNDNLQALCHMCHMVKTKKFLINRNIKTNKGKNIVQPIALDYYYYHPEFSSTESEDDDEWVSSKISYEIDFLFLDITNDTIDDWLYDMRDFLDKKSRKKIKSWYNDVINKKKSKNDAKKAIEKILYVRKEIIIKTRKISRKETTRLAFLDFSEVELIKDADEIKYSK